VVSLYTRQKPFLVIAASHRVLFCTEYGFLNSTIPWGRFSVGSYIRPTGLAVSHGLAKLMTNPD